MQQYDVQVQWQTVQHYLRRGASVLFRKIVLSCDVVSCDVVSPDLVLPSVVSCNVVLHQTVQQYDVDVEWQAVQHYLRRSASEVVCCDVVSPDLARPIVLSPNLVLPSVGLCRSSCSSCS